MKNTTRKDNHLHTTDLNEIVARLKKINLADNGPITTYIHYSKQLKNLHTPTAIAAFTHDLLDNGISPNNSILNQLITKVSHWNWH